VDLTGRISNLIESFVMFLAVVMALSARMQDFGKNGITIWDINSINFNVKFSRGALNSLKLEEE
jgi:hypothetical protein